MSIFSFSSYSSFFLAPPLTPPCPPSPLPSPQKSDLFIIRGRIVTLERTTFDVNRCPTPQGALLLKGSTPQGQKVSRSKGQQVKRSAGQ
jgi:hypothetical protein